MVTANDLLAQIEGVEDRVCVIDLVTRKINIPSSIVALGVEHDDDVKRLCFRMPRMYGDVDMSTFNIRINYMNAANEGDIYVVTDKQVDGDIITFSWRVGPHAFVARGNVNFIACFKGTDPSNTSNLRELNTTVASLPVLEGLEVDAAPLEGELQDILEQLETLTADKIASIEAKGETQLEKLQTKSEEEQENIRGTADYIRATFGDDYETTVKMARTRANAIVQTAEGETISVDDASDDPLRGLRVFGKSTQASTTGTQLWNNEFTGPSSLCGVTLTYKDGVYALNGTCNTSSNFRLGVISLTDGKYTLSANNPKNNGKDLPNVQVYSPTTLESLPCKDNVNNAVATTDLLAGDDYELRIRIEAGVTYSGYTLKPVLNAGTESLPWEPYSGGYASPSPEWTQPVESIENPSVRIIGKNLLDTSAAKCNLSSACNWASIAFNNAFVRETLRPSTTYTMRFKATSIKDVEYSTLYSSKIGFGLFDFDTSKYVNMATVGDLGVGEWLNNGSSVDIIGTFTTPANLFDLSYQIIFYTQRAKREDNSSVSNTIKFTDLQIEYGDTVTDYEPYSEQPVSLTRTLPGIPVTSGGNYTDENGQQWICDEIDFERGVYVQRIGAAEYVGSDSEPWLYNTGIGLQKDPVFLLTLSKLNTTRSSTDRAIICNSYAAADKLPVQNNEYWKVDTYFGIKQVAFRNDNYTDLSGWKAYLKEHPIRLIYELATPIETPLTETELAAYAALHSNYPNTTVLNDQGAHMELKYNADTATFFIRSRASAELIQAAVNAYLDKTGVQVPSDEHINDLIDETVNSTLGVIENGSY